MRICGAGLKRCSAHTSGSETFWKRRLSKPGLTATLTEDRLTTTTETEATDERFPRESGLSDGASNQRCRRESMSAGEEPRRQYLLRFGGTSRLAYPRNLTFRGNVSDATVMLAAVERGDPKAAEELLVLVYDELRRIAAFKMAHESPGQTLQPTALVHEAWMRLIGNESPTFNNRAHFFHTASEAMRRILIDRARRKRAERHGGRYLRVELDGFDPAAPGADDQLLAVHEAVDKLAVEHPVQAQLV